jgi:hypothetical protein
MCQTKSLGGLGIVNLEAQNVCLLSKWLFKLLNEDGMWQKLIRRKYLKNNTLSQVTNKPSDSHFWSGLMDIKDHFLSIGRFLVHNGEQIRFCEDVWLGNQKLKDRYSCLYNIVRRKK